MDSILRGAAIYFFLLILFRLADRRTLAELTAFDFVLLLIIGQSTQQGLLGDDFSVTNAFVVIASLVALDIGFGLVKARFPSIARLVDGLPLVIVENGHPLVEECAGRGSASMTRYTARAHRTGSSVSIR
jgi:uncharacterized membrane protein YcaP (DUF421 family)